MKLMSPKRFICKSIKFLGWKGMFKWIPDERYLKICYYGAFGKSLNLQNPITYNEKLQWLKLYNHDPMYVQMADKYEVRNYIKERVGEDYLIPIYGVWDRFDDIDFSKLPRHFVLKYTHDSGGVVICKNRKEFDKKKAKRILENHMKKNFYYVGREWPYKNIRPRIIAEQYLEDSGSSGLIDYKFFSFHGKVRSLFIATERQSQSEDTKFDFFDPDYNHLDIINGHPNAKAPPEKPKHFDRMIEISEKLSEGLPHVRVDFYEADGKLYIGELTLSHWSGFVPFVPDKWDKIFGSWLDLNSITMLSENHDKK